MKTVVDNAIIYEIGKFSDKSAILKCYTEKYGKIKLFAPYAYGKRAALSRYIPGVLNFTLREGTDLYRFINFSQDSKHVDYVLSPEIFMRLCMVFDILENCFDMMEADKNIWYLFTRYTVENAPVINIYTICTILRKSGLIFSLEECCSCGTTEGMSGFVLEGQFYCISCGEELPPNANYISIPSQEYLILKNIFKGSYIKSLKLDESLEKKVLDILFKHVKSILHKDLKSFDSYLKLNE